MSLWGFHKRVACTAEEKAQGYSFIRIQWDSPIDHLQDHRLRGAEGESNYILLEWHMRI